MTEKFNIIKLRNAFTNSIVLFLMIGAVSAVLAVLTLLPTSASIVLAMFVLLFMTMVAVEYGMERDDD